MRWATMTMITSLFLILFTCVKSRIIKRCNDQIKSHQSNQSITPIPARALLQHLPGHPHERRKRQQVARGEAQIHRDRGLERVEEPAEGHGSQAGEDLGAEGCDPLGDALLCGLIRR